MKKIRAAIVGYGNIGHYALEALEAANDFEVAGIVRRHGAENKPAELAQYDVVKDIRELKMLMWPSLPPPLARVKNMLNRYCPWASTPLIVSTFTPLLSTIVLDSCLCAKRMTLWL